MVPPRRTLRLTAKPPSLLVSAVMTIPLLIWGIERQNFLPVTAPGKSLDRKNKLPWSEQ